MMLLALTGRCRLGVASHASGFNRCFATRTRGSIESSYIDKWFESIVKSEEFYAEHGEGDTRRYFYNVDMQGRLFLEETLPKNIATSIKDERFLNFFFSRVQRVRAVDREFLDDHGLVDDYPFVSLCGKEINYIRPAATPIVFHAMVNHEFFFGGDLKLPFNPSLLAVSQKTGRLYHQLSIPGKKTTKGISALGYGLVRSAVAVSLSEHIFHGESDESDSLVYLTPEGPQPIQWLPAESEPGDWALPDDGSAE